VIDARHPGGLESRQDSGTVPVLSAVDQQGMTARRDDERRGGLLHVDVVDPERLGGRYGGRSGGSEDDEAGAYDSRHDRSGSPGIRAG
jgi:hypothetical protein